MMIARLVLQTNMVNYIALQLLSRHHYDDSTYSQAIHVLHLLVAQWFSTNSENMSTQQAEDALELLLSHLKVSIH